MPVPSLTTQNPVRALALWAVALMVGGIGLACGGDASLNAASQESGAAGIRVPTGFEAVDIVTGLRGPTQMAVDADGRLLVAELAGGEGAGTGRVIAFAEAQWSPDLAAATDASEAAVLFEDLVKPTGLAVIGDRVWIMEERSLSFGPITGGPRNVVLDELPNNGRSQGTLTAAPDGRLLYNTSGSIFGGEVVVGSGVLWAIRPDAEPTAFATGFKHAYARTFDEQGRLWQTEMSDGSYDGQAAADELVQVEEGDDFGWPRCVDDRRPVSQYGGSEESCAGTPNSHALFEPGATPTAVEVAPWDVDSLLVALWNRAVIMTIPMDDDSLGADGPVGGDAFLRGMDHPQDLLAVGDRLLVADHEAGRIVAVTKIRDN